MCKLAKVWVFIAACLFSLAAQAQVAVISGQAIDQNGQPLANVQVRVCSVTSTGVPCTPPAAIFYDFGLTQQAPNPYTTDQYGNYTVYAGTLPAPNLYTVQYSPGSGVTWAYVVNGPFLSAAGGTVTGFITALGYNGVPEADQCSGSDAFAKINTCAALLPSGGVEDARGFGATIQTVTTKMTALATPTRPITLELNPATRYELNIAFSAGAIASSAASQTSGANGACMVPISNGSAVETQGFNSLGGTYLFQLGPSAATYDVVCNGQQDGTQESFKINGLSIEGNAAATMTGSLLHVVKTYVPTSIINTSTYYPFGNGLTITGGNGILLENDNFMDGYPYAGGSGAVYPGAVVTLACSSNLSFIGGSIEDNGLHNPLFVVENCVTNGDGSQGVPTTGQGYNSSGIHLKGTYIEIEPATVGTFSGAPTNVDPFILIDPVDFKAEGMGEIFGNGGPPAQQHMFDIENLGSTGLGKGPVEIDGITTGLQWANTCLVNNTISTAFVDPNLRCITPNQNGPSVAIGKYRWEGSSASPTTYAIDYEGYKNFSNMQAVSTNGAQNAALQTGGDIGAKVSAALAACGLNCEVDIPEGTYNQTTSINLPLNFLSHYTLHLMPGAVLLYSGSGCAINTQVSTTIPTDSNLDISGGQIYGTAAGQAAICLQPTNSVHVHDIVTSSFTNGYGVWIHGANTVTVENVFASGNAAGVYATPTYCTAGSGSNPATCSDSPVTVSGYTPNMINVVNNTLIGNQYGVQFFDQVSNNLSPALSINISGNDLELNTTAGVYIGRSRAATVQSNYFEGDGLGVSLGNSSGTSFFQSAGTRIVGNFFTVTQFMLDDIFLGNATDTVIDGNSQNYGGSEISGNCFINGLPLNSGVSGGETNTYVGHNHVELASVGSYLCENGTGVAALTGAGSFSQINSQYQTYMADQSFQINTTVTSENVGLQYLLSTGSCQLHAPPGNSTAIQNTRAALVAQPPTLYVSAITNAQITLAHPSGNAMSVDIVCENNPNGGYQ